jgi:alpha-beta hydrolase superfamily lysophospholipase
VLHGPPTYQRPSARLGLPVALGPIIGAVQSPPRVVVAASGHEGEAGLEAPLARALRDAGVEVVVVDVRGGADELARAAIDEDCSAIVLGEAAEVARVVELLGAQGATTTVDEAPSPLASAAEQAAAVVAALGKGRGGIVVFASLLTAAS